MKIYTKRGDKGHTSLIGGDRVPKSHVRIETYGTVDELNSYIGLLRSFVTDSMNQNVLKEIQDRLFTVGSILASAPGSKMIVPDLFEKDIELLETSIDEMNNVLPELRAFVLPAGSSNVAQTHIARCVCRRAERMIVLLNDIEAVDDLIIPYMNRLSDYLFVLSRLVAKQDGVEEVNWFPRV